MLENETERFGNTKHNFTIFVVLAIMIVASNILVYIGLSNRIDSLQPQPFPPSQTISGILEQRPKPQLYEAPEVGMVYVVSRTPNDSYPYYLSRHGQFVTYYHVYMETTNGTVVVDWLEEMDIHVGDKIEVDGLVFSRSDMWGDKTYKMFESFAMRKQR